MEDEVVLQIAGELMRPGAFQPQPGAGAFGNFHEIPQRRTLQGSQGSTEDVEARDDVADTGGGEGPDDGPPGGRHEALHRAEAREAGLGTEVGGMGVAGHGCSNAKRPRECGAVGDESACA